MIDTMLEGTKMSHYVMERALPEELAEAKTLLERALAILDRHDEEAAACSTCEAIERLAGAPSTTEQWYIVTGRTSDEPELP